MNNIYLVYGLSDSPEVFEVEPRYIKNEKFSAKNLNTNRARSFSFSGMLGLFEDSSEAESLLLQVKKNEAKSSHVEKLQNECDKNETKIERIQDQHDRLEERNMKKGEVIESLEERLSIEGLTEKQAERLAKANLDEAELGDKMEVLDGKIELLEKLNESNYEEMGRLEDEYANFVNELQKECLFKLHSLGIEDRTEAQVEVEVVEVPKIPDQAPPLPPPITNEQVQTSIQHSPPLVSKPTFIKKILGVFNRKK